MSIIKFEAELKNMAALPAILLKGDKGRLMRGRADVSVFNMPYLKG
jgi:hypothetical protein